MLARSFTGLSLLALVSLGCRGSFVEDDTAPASARVTGASRARPDPQGTNAKIERKPAELPKPSPKAEGLPPDPFGATLEDATEPPTPPSRTSVTL